MKLLIFLIPVLIWLLFTTSRPSKPLPQQTVDDNMVSNNLETLKEIKVTVLENGLSKLIKVGIYGIPGVYESTNDRTLRYLQTNNNNITLALEHAVSRISTPLSKAKRIALYNIPYLGLPYSLIDPYWHKVRYLLLVAKLNNHDLHTDKVKENVMYCLTNSVMHSVEQKIQHKIFTKVMTYVNKFIGNKIISKIASVPLNILNIVLENNSEIVECGKVKFGKH